MLFVPELSKIIKDNRTKLREWGGGQIYLYSATPPACFFMAVAELMP